MEEFGDCGKVGVEVTLGALGNTFTTLERRVSLVRIDGRWHTDPCDQDVLGQAGVRVLDLDEGKLDAAVGELLNQVHQFALCIARMLVSDESEAAG